MSERIPLDEARVLWRSALHDVAQEVLMALRDAIRRTLSYKPEVTDE